MDISTEAKIKIGVEDQASQPVRDLRREIDKTTKAAIALDAILGKIKAPALQSFTSPSTAKATAGIGIGSEVAALASLKRRWSFEARMGQQRADEAKAEESRHLLFEAAAVWDLRERMAVSSRFARQRAAEAENAERLRRTVETNTMSSLRRQMSASAALARQRITETRSAQREHQRAADATERDAASALRGQIAGHKYLLGLRQRQDRQDQAAAKARGREMASGRQDIGHGVSQMGQGASRAYGIAQSAATVGAVAQAAVAKAVESAFASRMKVETAETNLRMFGSTLARPGQNAKPMSAADVAEIRATWLDEASVGAGVAPEVGMKTYTEVLKAGIADDRAREMTELVLKSSAGMDMNAAEATRVMGRMATVMGGKDGVSGDRMQKVMTGMAIAASETAANPDEIISGMSRGMGALAYGMSPEDLAAWVATGASTGIQAGKTGNFVSTLLQNGIGAKNQRGQKLKDMDTAAGMVGMGSAQSMSRTAAKDPNAFLETMFERVERLSVEKRAKFSRLMGGQEWDDEILQMKQGFETLKKTRAAIKDERNKNFIDDNKDLKNESLSGLWARLKSRFSLLWESFGHGFSDTFSEVATWFIASGRAINLAGLRSVGASLMTGLVNGLGFQNWTALLRRVFDAGKLDLGHVNQTVTRFVEGFGSSIRSMAIWARDILGIATGSGFDARTLGKVTAGFLGLAAGLLVVAPVVGLLGIAAGGLRLLAGGVGVLNGALTAMGIGGLTGAGAKLFGRMGFGAFAGGAAGLGIRAAGAAALAGLTIVGGGILLAGLAGIGALYVAVTNWDAIKRWISGGTMANPDLKAAEDRLTEQQGGDSLASKMWNWFNQSGDAATVQRQSYGGEHNGAFDRRGLIQNAAFGGQDRTPGGFRGFDGAQLIRAALTAPGTGAAALVGMGASPGAGATPGFPGIGGARGPGDGGPAVPGWFGKGGGGSASSNPANSAASATMLDAIAGTESGKAGYDTVLGNGKYGMPSKPVSTMTLDEAFAFGRTVKARHGSSSALGRYQIVGNTMRAAQKALGVAGDAQFDPAMQDRMARWIARNQGLGAWEGLKHNPTAMAAARQAMTQGGAQDAPNGSGAVALLNPKLAAGIPGLGEGKGKYDGLRIKGGQAIGGGGAHLGVTDLARQAQANLPGGVKHSGALNDQFHAGRRSKHNQGLAFDTSLMDRSQSGAAAEAMRSKLRAAGLNDDAFRVIDEYRNPSAHSTGGHLHTQFNSKEAAQKYHQYVEGLMKARSTAAASPGAQDASDLVRPGQGFGAKAPSAEDLTSKVPMPAQRSRGAGGDATGPERGGAGSRAQGGNGGSSPQVVVNNVIHAGNQNPQEMAGHIQRHVTEAWAYRSHDLEPELT